VPAVRVVGQGAAGWVRRSKALNPRTAIVKVWFALTTLSIIAWATMGCPGAARVEQGAVGVNVPVAVDARADVTLAALAARIDRLEVGVIGPVYQPTTTAGRDVVTIQNGIPALWILAYLVSNRFGLTRKLWDALKGKRMAAVDVRLTGTGEVVSIVAPLVKGTKT